MDQTITLTHDGLERRYIVHVPAKLDGRRAAPVVIMFHGGGDTALGATFQTGWDLKSDAEGFLAVFPEATRLDPSNPAQFPQQSPVLE